jgi:hypothetical protein
VIINPTHYVLAIRKGNTLEISSMFNLHCAEAADVLQTMSLLSFFFANALLSYFGLDDSPIVPPEPPGCLNREEAERRKERMESSNSHIRSDSAETVRPGGGFNSAGRFGYRTVSEVVRAFVRPAKIFNFLTTVHIYFQIQPACQRLYQKLFHTRQVPQRQIVTKCSLINVVFTTSGTPSATLPLTPVVQAVKRFTRSSTLTIHGWVKQTDPFFTVLRAQMDGLPIVVKMAEYESVDMLLREAEIYTKLGPLQGLVIPIFYGFFLIRPTCALLLMEDCGMALQSFSTLSMVQRLDSEHGSPCL